MDVTVSDEDSPSIQKGLQITATFSYRNLPHVIRSELGKAKYQNYITFTGKEKIINGERFVDIIHHSCTAVWHTANILLISANSC